MPYERNVTALAAVRTLRNVCDVHLRVNLLGTGDSVSRVVLSASYDLGYVNLKNEAASANRHGWTAKVWKEVETAAAAVRPAVTEPAATANQ